MKPSIVVTYLGEVSANGNTAKVGNIMASGPCIMMHWSGPLHGEATKIDRSSVDSNFGKIVDRIKIKKSNPALFPCHKTKQECQ